MTNKYTIHKQLKTNNSLLTKSAFTLAETLIVMGIIGVVAALTLPNLNSSTGDKEKVVKLKKIYSNISDAYGRAQAIYGPADEWFAKDTTATAQQPRFMNRLTEFMKVSKKENDTSYILADGARIFLYQNTFSPADNKIFLDVDLDGINKGQNKYGHDIFRFTTSTHYQSGDHNISTFKPFSSDDTTFLGDCSNSGNEWCTAWVINFDNMDYLKTDIIRKCDNGTVLNATANPPVTSCK